MIVLFTDFGLDGPYTGQMKAVLARRLPDVPVIDLFSDAPVWDPRASAYLLAAYVSEFPAGSVFLCVVDPGVGGDRAPVVVEADGRWFVGPDNGLFELVARRAIRPVRQWTIVWRPATLSASFHGRDLFAPIAARLAVSGEAAEGLESGNLSMRNDWPDDLTEIVYIDVYGNGMTGLRGAAMNGSERLEINGQDVLHAEVFSAVPPGAAFWYVNSNGLVEIAVNQGRADRQLGLKVGQTIAVR